MGAPGVPITQPRDPATGRFLQRFPTAESRVKVWAELCEHLARGHGVGSFSGAAKKTVYYLRDSDDYPECCPDEFDRANREGLKLLESLTLRAAATGEGNGPVAFNMLRQKSSFLAGAEWRADDDSHLASKAAHDRELALLRLSGGGEAGAVEVPAGRVEVVLRVVDSPPAPPPESVE